MIEFDKKTFNDNKVFLCIMFIVVLSIFVVSILFSGSASNRLEEKELETEGNSEIHKLVVNEVMLSNDGAYADSEGNLYDWIELYNGKDTAINLKNYGLSDRENEVKWVFPEVIIEPKSYLVIFLSGQKQDGLYANFKLNSSGGEIVALKNPNGKVIDAVETTPTDKNAVMARDLNGFWFESRKATPGFINTEEGYNSYCSSLKIDKSDIIINEVLPRNKGNFVSPTGDYDGYIEIMNVGKETVDLKNYSLSNDWNSPFKYQLPSIQLKTNEVIVIYTSNDVYEDILTTGFKLDAKTGVALLTNNKGQVIDEVTYSNLANGMAKVLENNNFYDTNQISPGYKNNRDGVSAFSDKYLKNNKELIINEVMNSNSKYLVQNGDNYYDWIELKNNSKETINLKDYALTTNDDLSTIYKLPDVKLKAGEIYVVIASGDSNLSNSSYKHLDFKISEVESIYLVKDNDFIDSIFVANVPLGYSMGRDKTSGYFYFSKPTPKKENGSGTHEVSYVPTISQNPGVYNDVENVKVELNANGTIYYTLDGSIPNTSSKIYKGPIFLTKTTVVKAVSYESGKIKSDIAVGSYVINENHTMPVMSVSLNQSDFNKVQSNNWSNIEVSAHAELYEEGKSFSIPCGFQLFGGSTRGLPKKSFALKFKKQYGESELHYQVFDNRDFSVFNTLILRSGSQDYENAMMRDVLMTSLVDGVTNLDVQAYKSVILYINGKYWGIYNIREKVDEEFISNHYNVDEERVNIIRIDGQLTCGTKSFYTNLTSYMNSHDLSKTSNYEYVKEKLNIESYADFWVAEGWTTNNDIINTRFFSHPDVDNGRIRMIFFDLDFAMYFYKNNYYTFSTNPDGMSALNVSTAMMRNIIKSKEFKKVYLERVVYQLNNVWTEERVLAKIEELYNDLLPEISRDHKRWNLSLEDWKEDVDVLRTFAKNRRKYMISQTKSFFGLSNKEVEKYFGD